VIQPDNIMLQREQQPSLRTSGLSATTTTASNASAAPKTTYESTRIELEALTTRLINSSDILVTELGVDSAKNSLNVVLLEILFEILTFQFKNTKEMMSLQLLVNHFIQWLNL
jgi:hypothetical protein